jgi:SlyX protein
MTVDVGKAVVAADLENLETRIAFQERTIQTLQDELYRQQREIAALKLQLRGYVSQLGDISETLDGLAPDQPPPHY